MTVNFELCFLVLLLPPTAHPGLGWTPSRKHLELLLNQEQATSLQDQVLQTHEQRLASRLMRLNLDMLVVPGDGNCQV